ncbi:uncharacterized protein LOC115033429 [Acyrthosiphon pisum]|uniref:Uncharacterized protein n=1 Tax=Acyrthosiphon pisum TaxID=7029 RepID=A0A8R2NKC2_ACYPI|nr:uncharacterized protein LOC115033429 [Acyrthosiphon pisum]
MECKKVIRSIIVTIIILICMGIRIGLKKSIEENAMKESNERAMRTISHFTYPPLLQADNAIELENSRKIDGMLKRIFHINLESVQHETSYMDSGFNSNDASDVADQMDE